MSRPPLFAETIEIFLVHLYSYTCPPWQGKIVKVLPHTRANKKLDFFCVGAMYSGEYDACDVTLKLSVYPHRASLKNMPGHVGKAYFSSLPGVDIHSE